MWHTVWSFYKGKWILAFIILVAIIIRLKYTWINSAEWWDAGEYLTTARHWAFGIPYEINSQRPVLFPLIMPL